MNVLRRLSVVVLVAAMSLHSRTARADDPPPTTSSSGWALIAFSALAGAVITAVSASIDCRSDDLECARWTSLGIWGGIGVASGGTVAGIMMVRSERRAQSLPPPPPLNRSSGMPMCTF